MATPTPSQSATASFSVSAIAEHMEEHMEEEVESEDGERELVAITGFFCVLLVLALLAEQISHHRKWIYVPEGLPAMSVGLVVAFLDYFLGGLIDITSETSAFILVFLLPPILFNAGFALKKTSFFNELGTVTILAFLGTMICIYLIGVTSWGYLMENNESSADPNTDELTEPKNFFESLMFGTLISAVDPVSSLTVFGNLFGNLPPFFYFLLFGESVLNDAVCIVFYRAFRFYWIDITNFGDDSYGLVLLQVVLVTVVSIAVGIIGALVTSLLLKHTSLKHSFTATLFTILILSFTSFLAAEYIEYSGIMAILICGMFQRHYTMKNLDKPTRVLLPRVFEAVANAAETLIFAFMGASLVFLVSEYRWNPGFIVVVIIMCFASRFVAIFGLTSLANCKRKRDKIELKHKLFLWFAGLRGAIAFSLVIDMAASQPSINTEVYATTTVAVILFTTIFCGSTVMPVLTKLKLTPDALKAEQAEKEASRASERKSLGGVEEKESKPHVSAKARRVFNIDSTILMPLFVTKEGVEAYKKAWNANARLKEGGGTSDADIEQSEAGDSVGELVTEHDVDLGISESRPNRRTMVGGVDDFDFQ